MSAALKVNNILRPEQIIEAVISGPHTHVCQTQGYMFQKEMDTTSLLTQNQDEFFENPAVCGLWPEKSGQIKDKDVLLFNREFQSSKEKMDVLEDLKNSLSKLTKSSSLIDELAAVADEIVTNALFNAPFVDPVTHVNKRVDRMTTVVELPADKKARLFAADDGERVMIGVKDPFGSLDTPALLKRIGECYSYSVPVNFGAGGAGIGCFIVFKIGASVYLGVKPGKTTIVACVVPYRMSRKLREQLPKHLHWIQTK